MENELKIQMEDENEMDYELKIQMEDENEMDLNATITGTQNELEAGELLLLQGIHTYEEEVGSAATTMELTTNLDKYEKYKGHHLNIIEILETPNEKKAYFEQLTNKAIHILWYDKDKVIRPGDLFIFIMFGVGIARKVKEVMRVKGCNNLLGIDKEVLFKCLEEDLIMLRDAHHLNPNDPEADC